MHIKEYSKPGVVAWSNSKVHSQLLASASFQEEDGLYHLDILSLDLQQRSRKINIIGNGYTDNPFRCIAWDNFGQKDNSYTHGLIFTGMQDSTFKLWNPAEMIATYSDRPAPSIQNIDLQNCIIYEQDSQPENTIPVMCAEWNGLNNNILAFGTTDVFIVVLNPKKMDEPDLRKPGKKNPHQGSYVTSVSWNRQVSHILASASQNGLVALWDIKTNNSIFQFRDSGASSSGNRNVEICWSKNISTQIAVTLDDEKHNQLQIWDLRNQKGPVVVIDKCHSKGINAMDWCETDPELILTTSRDKKVVCWNYTQQEEPLSETQLESQISSVKWSKRLPSIYSVSTQQKTSIYTLNDANLFSYVPKWYKIPVGSTILGNQNILTYSEQKGNILFEASLPEFNKKSTIKPKLQSLSEIIQNQFEQADGQSELAILIKAKNGENDTEIYDYLGFSKNKIVQQVQKYTGKKREFAAGSHKEKTTKHKPKAYTQIQGQDALAFFASINSQSFEQTSKSQQDQSIQRVQYDMVPRNFNWDLGKQKIVKQNILIGNYQGAIDAALKCGRTAQALIIAYSVDQNLFNNTLKTFFTETTDSFITDVLKHIAYKDALELVKRYDLSKWKECVALILSFASKDKRNQLLKVLAQRLRTQSEEMQIELEQNIIPQNYAAIICLILAQDFNNIAEIYSQNLKLFKSGEISRKLAAIEYAKRLIIIYEHLTVQISDLKVFQKIVREAAFIAIEQHQKNLAHHLLSTYAAANSQKILDYLINTTKDLQKYKGSVKTKVNILPIMQAKKQQKKVVQKTQANNKPQKPKAKIFDRQEEQPKSKTSIPPPKSKVEESNNAGFSPFENQKPSEVAPPKKANLNTPPPMPVSIKKPVVHVEDEEEEPKKIQPPIKQAQKPQPPAPIKKPPPPPSPPQNINNSYSQQKQRQREQPRQLVKPPPPMNKQPTLKQPPPIQKPVPPPPAPKSNNNTSFRQEVNEPQNDTPKIKTPPPPPQKNIVPPPSRQQQQHTEYEQPQRQQNNYPKKPVKLPPPPSKIQQSTKPKNIPPPSKVQERRVIQQKEEVGEPVIKKPPPPPLPAKKNIPPPPGRR